MIRFVPYEAAHLAQVELQPAQARWRDQLFKEDYAKAMAVPGMAWTGLDGDRVVGCAGFYPQWEGRVIAWAVFGAVPRDAWMSIVRKVRKELRDCLADHGRHRVEATVPYNFGNGCRFAHALGFKVEALMKHYGPDGSDHFLYAQVVE